MGKTLCKNDKEKTYDNPRYLCAKCGRKANKKTKLCKPQKLKSE